MLDIDTAGTFYQYEVYQAFRSYVSVQKEVRIKVAPTQNGRLLCDVTSSNAGTVPQAGGQLDCLARAALERRPRPLRPAGAMPLERGGLGARDEISCAWRATARAV